jgi:hypothetical protein
MPRFLREGKSAHPLYSGFASSTSQKQDEEQSLLLTSSSSAASRNSDISRTEKKKNTNNNGRRRRRGQRGAFSFQTIPENEAVLKRDKEEDEGDYYYDDTEEEEDYEDYDDYDEDEEEEEAKYRRNNGVSHNSSKVYVRNLFIVAFMMMMCTLATCVGIASAYRPSRTGMVGRRDVHPNKNVHVVAESFSDVKESKMVIDEYIEKKKEKMMREKEMLEKMSESDGERETPASGAAIETNDAKSSDSSSPSSSSSEKGRESRSRKSASRKNSKKMKAGKQEREEQSSTEEAEAKTTTIVENITPKTLLETVRDVKHVHEA